MKLLVCLVLLAVSSFAKEEKKSENRGGVKEKQLSQDADRNTRSSSGYRYSLPLTYEDDLPHAAHPSLGYLPEGLPLRASPFEYGSPISYNSAPFPFSLNNLPLVNLGESTHTTVTKTAQGPHAVFVPVSVNVPHAVPVPINHPYQLRVPQTYRVNVPVPYAQHQPYVQVQQQLLYKEQVPVPQTAVAPSQLFRIYNQHQQAQPYILKQHVPAQQVLYGVYNEQEQGQHVLLNGQVPAQQVLYGVYNEHEQAQPVFLNGEVPNQQVLYRDQISVPQHHVGKEQGQVAQSTDGNEREAFKDQSKSAYRLHSQHSHHH